MSIIFSEEYYMSLALELAELAYNKDEVPVGSIVVYKGKIIGKGYNLTECLKDSTSHAEIQAITAACSYLGCKYLTGCTLFVSLEPCLMCAGAIHLSRISKLVYGAKDNKKGYSNYGINLGDKLSVKRGVLSEESSRLLSSFFVSKRKGL